MAADPNHPEPGARVAVGMSGGLDSSVVAALLQEQGYEVIGLTLHLFKEGARCCSIEDVNRSRDVCDTLGIRHATINGVEYFENTIIGPFIEGYAGGRTPSPCVLCNQYVKFGLLQDRARQLGCSHVGTGHYVRKEWREHAWHLYRAKDSKKDQSYFLHRLSQEQLSRCLFPLESWTKQQTAAYAETRRLPVNIESKAESQDLCFVPDDGHGRYVEEKRPDLKRTGRIVDPEGNSLGEHTGIHHFTIGQRKGLGVAAAERLYVKELNPSANEVVLAPRQELQSNHCFAEQFHWLTAPPAEKRFQCTARVRYRHEAAAVEVICHRDSQVELLFKEPQFAITPGQAAVLYLGDEVLGGGWISTRREAA